MSDKAQKLSEFKSYLVGIEKEYDKLSVENADLKKKITEMQKTIANYEKQASRDPNAKGINAENIRKTFVDLGQKVTSVLSKTNASVKFHKSFNGHTDVVWSIRVLPMYNKHQYIATASADGACSIWSLDHENPLISYLGHSGSVNQVKFHPTNPLALTCSGDASFHLWKFNLDAPGEQPSPRRDETEEHKSEDRDESESDVNTTLLNTPFKKMDVGSILTDCEWTPDSNGVVVGCLDGTAKLFNVSDSINLVYTFKGHDAPINGVSMGNQNGLVTTCSRDKTVRIWDIKSGECVNSLKGHQESVSSAVWASNDKIIVSGGDDGMLKFWDIKNLKTPLKSVVTRQGINKISISSYHSRIGVTLNSRRARVYDLSGSLLTHFPKSHSSMVTDCTWGLDGSSIFTCSTDKSAKQWIYNTDV